MTRMFSTALFLAMITALPVKAILAQAVDCDRAVASEACDQCGLFACEVLNGCDARGMCSCKSNTGLLGGEHLLGDWFGLRSGLAERGVVSDIILTQFYQGVSSGGNDEVFRYGDKADYFFTFLGEPLGLNEGFTLLMHGESRFGQAIIPDAELLAPSNTAMLMPQPATSTGITSFQVLQALSEKFALTAGKINALDFFNTLYPQTGRGINHFMNTSSFFPLTVARTVPLSFMGAGALTLNEGRIQGALLAIDSNNVPTTTGFDNLFDNGANIVSFWRFFTEFGDQPGSHLFMGTYANGTYTSLDPTGWSVVPGAGLVAPEAKGSWSATYIVEQQLWADGCDPARTVGLFSQWGLADPDTSPYAWCMNVSLQGKGLVRSRRNDWMGASYFYSGLSNELKTLASPILPLGDVQGGELYYNAAILPSCFLTSDLQVVQPADLNNDTAIVLGLRLSMNL